MLRGVRSSVLGAAVLLALTGCAAPSAARVPAATPSAAPVRSSAAAPGVSSATASSPSSDSSSPGTPSASTSSGASASGASSGSSASGSAGSDSTGASTKNGATAGAFDLSAHSLSDPTSIWVVVDKRRPLQPKSWVPRDLVQPDVPHTNVPQLRKPAARALERMVAAARKDGVGVVSLSAYRAYTVQKSIYDRNLSSLGRAATEKLTARPGYSEHQTGLADDLGDRSGRCGIQTCFASTAAGRWLKSNAWRYGWILRYPSGQQAVTGIQSEPWHYRYVGTALSKHMHATGQTLLEHVFGLPDSPYYR